MPRSPTSPAPPAPAGSVSDDGGEIYRRTLPDDAFSVAFSPDGRRLAYGGRDHLITITDSTGQHIKCRLAANIETGALAFSPDGRLLASGHGDSVIRLWSMPDGKLKAQLAKHARAIDNLAFSPDGRTLLSTSRDRTIRAWSVEQSRDYGVVLRVDPLHVNDLAPGTGCDFSLSADGRWFAALYKDHVQGDTLELLELQSDARPR